MAENCMHTRRNRLRFTITDQQQPQLSSHIFQTNITSPLQLNPSTVSLHSSSSSSPQILQQQPNSHTPFNPFPLNLHAQAPDRGASVSSGFKDSSKQHNGEVRSPVPLGPFTGYASILKRSRFLKPSQQILDEFCGTLYFDSSRSHVDSFSENPVVRDFIAFTDRIDRSWKASKLVLMLEEVYWQYKLYCQQMQSVVASFETVAGLGHAAPYISFAFKAISKHFCCLKNAILDQINVSGKTVSDRTANNDTMDMEQGRYSQKPVQKLGFLRPPHWRSQRALPDHAVAALKTWLYGNFLHPYPNDSEKQMLAQRTGLSKNQVSNWFINARVRLWKPMVEEILMLTNGETQTQAEATIPNFNMPSDKVSRATQSQQAERLPTKHGRHKRAQIPEQNAVESSAYLSALPSDQNFGCVSLALSLNQNSGNEISRLLPVSTSRHFDLEFAAEAAKETACEAPNHGQSLG